MKEKYTYIVIEDDTNVWDNIRIRMSKFPKWEALEFSSELEDALEKIEKKRPDLIFTDWSIRGGNAYQILSIISEIRDYRPYVVFFTGYQSENPEIPQRIINDFQIVNKYIVKPIYENLTKYLADYVYAAEMQANKYLVSKNEGNSGSLFLDTEQGKVRVFASELLGVLQLEETPRHKTLLLKNNQKYLLRQTWEEIIDFLEELETDYFVAHNRKSIINKLFITKIARPYVWLDNDWKVKVSREQWKKIEIL